MIAAAGQTIFSVFSDTLAVVRGIWRIWRMEMEYGELRQQRRAPQGQHQLSAAEEQS